jgi:hypothetical protein
MAENKKPFGLSLSCKIAAEAIRNSVAPVSIILYNLLILQKNTEFPKALDTQFFSTQKGIITEQDKKTVTKILGGLHGYPTNLPELLEDFIKKDWVIKKSPIIKVAPKVYNNSSKPVTKSNKVAKPTKKETVTPLVTIKKNKII